MKIKEVGMLLLILAVAMLLMDFALMTRYEQIQHNIWERIAFLQYWGGIWPILGFWWLVGIVGVLIIGWGVLKEAQEKEEVKRPGEKPPPI